MMCEECGIRPATIRLMSIVDGEKVTRNLCARCLADVKKTLPNLDLSGLDGMLASLLAATKKMGLVVQPEIDITCPDCGMTYDQFQKSGLLGCAGCYKAFREPLSSLLSRVHGHSQHVGRAPGRQRPEHVGNQVNLFSLRQALQRAIQGEEYERAAVLRDQIRALSQDAGREEVPSHGDA